MPFLYSSEFRRAAIERMLAGEDVREIAAEFSANDSTFYKWHRQALIDVGESPGRKGYEADAPMKLDPSRTTALGRDIRAANASPTRDVPACRLVHKSDLNPCKSDAASSRKCH